jgi:hypothetical protein
MPNGRKGPHHHDAHSHAAGRPDHPDHPHHRAHRKRHRRRRRLRTLVLAATALLSPHHARPAKPKVSTSVSYKSPLPRFVGDEVTVRPDPKIYEPIIKEAAARHRVDPALIRAVMRFESAFHPMAVSRVGALGLMQLMPELAARLGVKDIFDPRENIMAGTRYLRELLDSHHGKVSLALASYNAGPGAVAKYHGVPPYRETRAYVKGITGFMKRTKTEAE